MVYGTLVAIIVKESRCAWNNWGLGEVTCYSLMEIGGSKGAYVLKSPSYSLTLLGAITKTHLHENIIYLQACVIIANLYYIDWK